MMGFSSCVSCNIGMMDSLAGVLGSFPPTVPPSRRYGASASTKGSLKTSGQTPQKHEVLLSEERKGLHSRSTLRSWFDLLGHSLLEASYHVAVRSDVFLRQLDLLDLPDPSRVLQAIARTIGTTGMSMAIRFLWVWAPTRTHITYNPLSCRLLAIHPHVLSHQNLATTLPYSLLLPDSPDFSFLA